MDQRKRSRDEFEGMAEPNVLSGRAPAPDTVLRVNDDDKPRHDLSAVNGDVQPDQQEWQTVGPSKKRKKLPKRDGGHYPAIGHSAHARLQSWVKVTDLQGLILYVLADGNAPQWCSVAHRGNFRKAVVLMIPGLEAGMFNGAIPLQKNTAQDGTTTENSNGDTTAISTLETTASVQSDVSPEATVLAANGDRSGMTSDRKHAEASLEQSATRRHAKPSPDDYYPSKLDGEKLPVELQPLASIFDHIWPIKTPGDDKFSRMHSPLASFLVSPVPKTKEQKAINAKGPAPPAVAKGWKSKRIPITDLLATTDELLMDEYVLHPAHFGDDSGAAMNYQSTRAKNRTSTADGWVDTPNISTLQDGAASDGDIEQGSTMVGRQLLVIDCEMCITSPEGVQPPTFSLTRMSAIDADGNVVLDELVKPADPITNYVTAYSGITPEMMETTTTTLQQAQQMLLEKITPKTILVGHSLNSDLNALQITHPFIIDTALLYPHPRGPPLKSSLKWLAQKYLSRSIQAGHGSTGHDSVEDARASLDLVKQKCEKGKGWGTSDASNESIFLRLSRTSRPKRDKVHPDGEAEQRTGAVVDWGDPKRGFGAAAELAIGCKTDSEVVAGIKRAISCDDDAFAAPVRGVDLVWARLRELEAYRKWWRSSKTVDSDELRERVQAESADKSLGEMVSRVVSEIQQVWEALPACTAFIVYSGSGDPTRLSEMQEQQRQFKTEYATKKWDELSVKWTDVEEQELRRACEEARRGIGFIAVK